MTAQLAPTPVFRAADNNGNPLFLGQLFTYEAGTTTPQATYVDSTQTTQNTNPVILNSRGECNLWLDPSLAYKLVLEDSAGNQIWSVDNISGALLATGNIIPSVDDLFTLGSPQFSWANVYLGALHAPALDASGNIGYWKRTAAEIAASVTPVNYAYQPGDVRRYGGDPTGGVTSDTALANAIAVCSTTGGTIYCPGPNANYTFGSAIALNNKSGIVLQGDGSASSGLNPGTRFTYNGTGSGVWIDLDSSQGVRLKNIQLVHSSASFTGTYLRCNNDGSHGDPAACGLDECTVGTSVGSVLHLDLNKCINFSCNACTFQYSGSSGSVRGAQSGGYSNNIAFASCEWFNGSAAYIQNGGPHQAWGFSSCTFEGLSQTTNSPAGAILSTASSGTWAGLKMDGCWLGDAGTAAGTWIDGYFSGAFFGGNYISGSSAGTTAFAIRQSTGVSIIGNHLTGLLNGINFATATSSDIAVTGNTADSVTNAWVNPSSCAVGTLNWSANFGLGIPTGHGAPTANNGVRVFADGTGGTAQGEIDQWGSSTVTSATGTITIASSTGMAFPNACTNVVGNISASANANGLYLTPSGVNFTYFITGTMPASVTFSWQAKGN